MTPIILIVIPASPRPVDGWRDRPRPVTETVRQISPAAWPKQGGSQ